MKRVFFALLLLACSALHGQEPTALAIKNIALKKVQGDGIFGKTDRFLYFFQIKNAGPEMFAGSVEIGLHNIGVNDEVTKETFEVEIPAGQARVVQVNSPTGPRKFHGDFSIKGFVYSVDGGKAGAGETMEDVGGLK